MTLTLTLVKLRSHLTLKQSLYRVIVTKFRGSVPQVAYTVNARILTEFAEFKMAAPIDLNFAKLSDRAEIWNVDCCRICKTTASILHIIGHIPGVQKKCTH